jgi:hypothetical protein
MVFWQTIEQSKTSNPRGGKTMQVALASFRAALP